MHLVLTLLLRDLLKAADLVALRLKEIKPELLAAIWRVALLSLYRYVALQRI